ncbi:Inorganic diphosphatase [Spironucleus salmonicida]|uniref:inorganic diphosphatase n=1 Tax=Spironucleus salmonicida TaxID=348837 RepID=V6LU25_9EUKA|nr:Inorganic diphosphatase [Spironucleus salmonicida]|eukprot:EST48110.1 Inorganic diphosphatase [Spironucleus salmonicida]
MSQIYVCGHKSPDTDSVMSALTYANYINQLNPGSNAIPIAAGPIAQQTQFILNKFSVQAPEIKPDITPALKDFPKRELKVLDINDPLSKAFEIFHESQHSNFPVVDKGIYKGVLNLPSLITVFTRPSKESELKTVTASIQSIRRALKATLIETNCQCSMDEVQDFNIAVSTVSVEDFKLISENWSDSMWKTSVFPISFNKEVIEYLISKNAGAIILSKSFDIVKKIKSKKAGLLANDSVYINLSAAGSNVDLMQLESVIPSVKDSSLENIPQLLRNDTADYVIEDISLLGSNSFNQDDSFDEDDPLNDIIHLFMNKNTALVTTNLTVASAVLLIKQSTPVRFYYNRDKINFINEASPIIELRNRFSKNPKLHVVAIVDDSNNLVNIATQYDLNNLNIIKLVLVDHNEIQQQVTGSQSLGVKIIEIVDHHKIAIESQEYTVKMTVRPLGCTCTIITQLYRQKGIPINKLIGSLLLSAIMTDTLVLKSPTTTQVDRDIVRYLEQITGIDHQSWGNEIFSAVEGFSGVDKNKTIRQDYKLFDTKLGKYGVSQVEVGSLVNLPNDLAEIKRELQSIRDKDNIFLVCCLVTDVTQGISVLLTDGVESLVEVMGYITWEGHTWAFDMPGVVSRKKQLMPHLINVVAQLG